MEQSFETMWRMAKVAGGIDTTVRLIETLIETVASQDSIASASNVLLGNDRATLIADEARSPFYI